MILSIGNNLTKTGNEKGEGRRLARIPELEIIRAALKKEVFILKVGLLVLVEPTTTPASQNNPIRNIRSR